MIRRKVIAAAIAAVVLGLIAFSYSQWTIARESGSAGAQVATVPLHEPGRLLFTVSTGPDKDRVAGVALSSPSGPRAVSDTRCQRFHAAAGVGVCVTPVVALVPTVQIQIVDRDHRETRRASASGTISRARVSASGNIVAWTTFVTGDSYAVAGFSTRTAILDLRSARLLVNMETIQLYLDGKRHHSPDVNYWGVTFTGDDNRFYATVATGGRTYLVEGDLAQWKARNIRQNAECPSLSPDGSLIAFKKKVSDGSRPWRLAILDLTTGKETEVPGTDGIDDQAIWLNSQTVAYGKDGDIYAAPADGSAQPHVIVTNATSPAAVTGRSGVQ